MNSYAKRFLLFCCVFSLTAVPAAFPAGAAQTDSTLVYSEFGREAVFANDDKVILRARPDKSSRKLAKASYGELLWRVEEDYGGTGWDKINYRGRIVYCDGSKLSAEDPSGTVSVTTNRKYYESMKKIALKSESSLQAAELSGLSRSEIIEKVGPLFKEDMKQSGILASVSLAQFILESDCGNSELAQNANNCFGMKADLSGNSWEGSTWDQSSVYTKKTSEQNSDGSYENIVADFRQYQSVSDSIADHSAYLAGARSDDGLRYPGLVGCTDYRKAAKIIKKGGYATNHDYVDNICRLIKKWDLTRFDS